MIPERRYITFLFSSSNAAKDDRRGLFRSLRGNLRQKYIAVRTGRMLALHHTLQLNSDLGLAYELRRQVHIVYEDVLGGKYSSGGGGRGTKGGSNKIRSRFRTFFIGNCVLKTSLAPPEVS